MKKSNQHPRPPIPPPSKKAEAFSHELKKNSSASERRLWGALWRSYRGFEFQVPIGPYIADIFHREARLVVEVDGPHHVDRFAQDKKRDAWFRAKGIQTVRVPTTDVWDRLDAAIDRVSKALLTRLEDGTMGRRSSKRRRRRRNQAKQRLAEVPEVFGGRCTAIEMQKQANGKRVPRPREYNPGPIPPTPKPLKPQPTNLRRAGGVYRAWQPPTSLPPLELPSKKT